MHRSKNIITIILIVFMLGILSSCSVEKNDEGFITNLENGLNERWELTSKGETQEFESDSEYKEYLQELVIVELDSIGNLSEYTFADESLSKFAFDYVEQLNNQSELLSNNSIEDLLLSPEYNIIYDIRASIIYQLYNNYGIEISENHVNTKNEVLADGKEYLEIQEAISQLNTALSSATLETVSTGVYKLLIENPSEIDFEYVEIQLDGLDEQGVTVAEGLSTLTAWSSGQKNEVEIYTSNDFTLANIALKILHNTDTYFTEEVNISVINNLEISIDLPSTPIEINNFSYDESIATTYTIDKIEYEVGTWYEEKTSVTIYLSGEKIFDAEGDDKSNYGMIDWKLFDENNNVLDSGSIFADELTVGQSFTGAEIHLFELAVGSYKLELSDNSF